MKLCSVARASLAALPLLGLVPALAFAQTEAHAVASPAAPAPAATGPLKVWVDAQGVPLDTARLQQSLSRELGREVVLSNDAQVADVAIRMKGESRAEVFYVTPEGEQLSREVDLPPDRERAVLVVSWLTVNLVRDEASELLRQLRARRKAEAEARAMEERAAAEKAAADKAAADKAAADKAAADAARAKAEKAAAEAAARPKPEAELLRDPLKSFDVALATPISLLPDSPKRELRLQLALGWGDSGAIRGIGATPSVLRIRRDLNGAAAAAACLLVERSARGIAASAGYARIAGKLEGIAIGAGAASAGSMEGALVTGGVGWTSQPSRGLMLSGGVNWAGDLEGIQVAGGVNVARDFRGIALAPVNVQRKVRGLQLGVINIADEVDGAAIGIISLARNGRLQPVVWGSGDGSAHVALKSIAGYAFTQFGGGVGLNEGASLSYDGGIGGHLRFGESLFFEPGVHYSATHKVADASGAPDAQYVYYLAMVGLRLGNKVDLLAGGGVRQLIVGGDPAEGSAQPEVRAGIAFF